MKQLEEQTHYEILEVSSEATIQEIQQAYDRARETFHSDSPAVYSLFSDEEMSKIQARIEEAYRVLMDEALRKSYDRSHSHLIQRSHKEQPAEKPDKPPEIKRGLSFTDLSLEIGEISYRGTSLRQLREKLGIDLNTISAETKISAKILERIEKEDLEHLPPVVYLKGFLKAYALVLHLDPQKLIDGYLELLQGEKKK